MKKYLLLLLLFPTCVSAQTWQFPTSHTTTSVPFVAISSTDHVTELTSIANVTCRRIKNGSDSACSTATITAAAGEVSDANHPGTWKYTLGSSDTDTAGSLVLYFTAAGMDPVRVAIQIGGVPANDFTAVALAKFFSVNTTQTAATAVAGSVVKEIIKDRPSSH